MKNRITIQSLRELDLNSLNEVLADIYRELNRIADSSDEITFRDTKDGNKELVIKDGIKEYVGLTKATTFAENDPSIKKRNSNLKVNNLEVLGKLSGPKGQIAKLLTVVEDLQIASEGKNFLKFNPSNDALTTMGSVKSFGGVYTGNANASHTVGTTGGYDSFLDFFRSPNREWKIGNDDTVGGVADTNTFKIEAGTSASFSDTSEFELDTSGNLTIKNNISCDEVIKGAPIWNSWEFKIFRATGNGTIASARRYYRDVDDSDDYRLWDAYFDNTTGSYVISTANIAGLFVVPENCKVGAMYGQIAGDGATSTTNPLIELWKFTPSNGSSATPLPVASVTANVGTSGDESYAFNQTSSFTNNSLSAGDVIIPTLAHSNAGAVQSYYGNLTVKFITT